MLATQSTLQSKNYQNLRKLHSHDCEIFEQACIGWVELVESGQGFIDSNAHNLNIIKACLKDIHQNDIDQIVLGCTHFPFLKPLILKYLESTNTKKNIQIVDTSSAVANHLKTILMTNNLLNINEIHPVNKVEIYSSANKVNQQLLTSLCQAPIHYKGKFE